MPKLQIFLQQAKTVSRTIVSMMKMGRRRRRKIAGRVHRSSRFMLIASRLTRVGFFLLANFTTWGWQLPYQSTCMVEWGLRRRLEYNKWQFLLFCQGRTYRLVHSETGSGKTILYLAPIVHHLQASLKKINRVDGTYALVLVPTRELCLQVYEVIQQLVHRFHWLVPGYIMGGENRVKEKARLRKGITLLVATPGRLLDHLQHTSSFRHDHLQWLVLDEADRLLDLGFGKDIENILSLIGSRQFSSSTSMNVDTTGHNHRETRRQHVLLSATLNEQVSQLASLSLTRPATVGLGDLARPFGESRVQVPHKTIEVHENSYGSLNFQGVPGPTEYTLPASLTQSFVKVPCSLRLVTLLATLRLQLDVSSICKMVVFFSTCDAVDFHYALISEFAWTSGIEDEKVGVTGFLQCKSYRLHGNMAQQLRTETFQEFNQETSALLLCTDVAARGLDIPRVTCIIQYDSPGDASEYVHRVGRTARLGKKGEAILFLQPCELDYLGELQKHGVMLKETSLERILDNIYMKRRKQKQEEAWASVELHPGAMILQKALEIFITKQGSLRHLAVDAFRSFIRAYTAHRGDLKRIFLLKKLHLGHVAKSFGLLERPSLLGKSSNKQAKRRAKKQIFLKRLKKKRCIIPAAMLE